MFEFEEKKAAADSLVDQSKARAGKNIAAGNITEIADAENVYTGSVTINSPAEKQSSKIEQLISKLKLEMENNVHAKEMVDALQYFHQRVAVDGIDGLEKKLEHSGREGMKIKALMQKEAFSKKLDEYAHYCSAQEIFAFLLAKADDLFDVEITPLIDTESVENVKKATKEKIVDPIMSEISNDIMGLNHTHINGMIYWLAEQCFVRWHK